ncbi:MAG: pyridoxamine 5'-phosphate oxidase family protein [Arenibacter latericius]|nr:pyridoxamine 5'-phosphate oxidase family protein [Arenibacter latericius]
MADLNINESTSILRNNYNGHLAYISNGKPYVVPITFYFDPTDNSIISYTGEGHKIDAMRENPSVSMVTEQIQSLVNWKSALIQGEFEELEGSFARQKLHDFFEGVKSVIQQKDNKEVNFINEFSSKSYGRGAPIVYRIKIKEITGKKREA